MRSLLLTAALLAACGGSTPARTEAPDDVPAPWPDPSVRSLQLYAVLTADPQAMQGPDAFAGVDAAVNGEGPRYKAIRDRARIVPSGYRVDFTVDFADLPHPSVDAAQLAGMVKALPPEQRAIAEKAKLAVFIRSDTRLLPQDAHVRLAGLVPLYVADTWGGVVLDLMARRAWTPDEWQAELAAPVLGEKQIRMVTREDEGGGHWLLTRGNPKFGLPDLEMRGISPAGLAEARGRFVAAERKLRAQGPSEAPKALCTGPKGTYDAECRRVE